MNREDFLRRIKDRPAGSRLPIESPPPDLPEAPSDLVRAFIAAAEANGSLVVRGDLARVRSALAQAVGEDAILAAASPDTSPLLEGLATLPADADPFAAPWGFAVAEAGLARTGSVCLVRSPDTPLGPSLLPPRIALFLSVSSLLWDLGDFLERLRPDGGSAVVISGPSRSADIENDLSVGVHGPGEVLVLVWDPTAG